MKRRKHLIIINLFCFIMIFLISDALAQEKCRILEYNQEDGTYLVSINNKTMLAITEDMANKMLKFKADLSAARKKIEVQEKLIGEYERFKEQLKLTRQHQREYIDELESVLKGYKDLHMKYKKLKEPWLRVETGVGATGGDTDPAVLFGLGIKQLRIWGFLQESNAGGIIGISFPVF